MASRARFRARHWLRPGSEKIQVAGFNCSRARHLPSLRCLGLRGSVAPTLCRPGGSAPQFYQEWRWRPPERPGPARPSPRRRGARPRLRRTPPAPAAEAHPCATGKGREIDRHGRLHAKTHGVLAGVIERDVFMRLKQAQLADAFGGHAAGGEIRDASAGKLEPRHWRYPPWESGWRFPRRGSPREFRQSATARCRYRESSGRAPRPRPGSAA